MGLEGGAKNSRFVPRSPHCKTASVAFSLSVKLLILTKSPSLSKKIRLHIPSTSVTVQHRHKLLPIHAKSGFLISLHKLCTNPHIYLSTKTWNFSFFSTYCPLYFVLLLCETYLWYDLWWSIDHYITILLLFSPQVFNLLSILHMYWNELVVLQHISSLYLNSHTLMTQHRADWGSGSCPKILQHTSFRGWDSTTDLLIH